MLHNTTNLSVTYCSLTKLLPYAGNARRHSKRQIHQIARSIETFGFTNPILIDGKGTVIAGHGRLEAAKLLGMDQVPAVCLDHMSEAAVRAYVIADNRLAELAEWDQDTLAIELQGLAHMELDFGLEVIGFETAEIDLIIGDIGEDDEPDPDDELPDLVPDQALVSRPGDLWLLGEHRLLCGDATDANAYAQLMDGGSVDLVFTDPPYNVPIAGHVSGKGKARHADFCQASGEMTEVEFVNFLQTSLGHAARASRNGAIHYVCMDWRHLYELQTAARSVYSQTLNLCVWAKTNGGMGSFYRSQHELVGVFKVGKAPHTNTIQLGRFGRNRSNVWTYPGVNSFGADRDEALAMHPTVKPVALVADAIRDCSRRGDLVLDPFVGSGTTLLAAHRAGRVAYAMELDPRYVDVAVQRVQRVAGIPAVRAEDGKAFDDLAGEVQ
jgi:DNA modification methylase